MLLKKIVCILILTLTIPHSSPFKIKRWKPDWQISTITDVIWFILYTCVFYYSLRYLQCGPFKYMWKRRVCLQNDERKENMSNLWRLVRQVGCVWSRGKDFRPFISTRRRRSLHTYNTDLGVAICCFNVLELSLFFLIKEEYKSNTSNFRTYFNKKRTLRKL